MTEAGWLTGGDPRAMLDHLELPFPGTTPIGARLRPTDADRGRVMGCRKVRRFVVAAIGSAGGLLLADVFGGHWDEVIEAWAEGRPSPPAPAGGPDRPTGRDRPDAESVGALFTGIVGSMMGAAAAYHAGRRPDPPPGYTWTFTDHGATAADLVRCLFGNPFRPVTCDPAWVTDTVVALATGIYDERAWDRLPVLADALEDAGCDDADVIGHCRGPGPHARGCWVVDLLLGKG